MSPEYKVAGLSNVTHLTSCYQICARLADGSWWTTGYYPNPSGAKARPETFQLKNGGTWSFTEKPEKIPFKPEEKVADVQQGYEGLTWTLSTDGKADIIAGGIIMESFGKKIQEMDKVSKIFTQYEPGSGARQIMMLKADGTVWLAGQNLGYVSNGDAQITRIKMIEHVKDMSASCDYDPLYATPAGIAMLEDGSVKYWGVSDKKPEGKPIDIPDISTLKNPNKVVKMFAGSGVLFVIDDAGKVWNWGWTGKPNFQAEPSIVDGISGAVDIQVNRNYRLALCKDGSVWAWGVMLPPQKIFDGVKLP